MRIRIITKDFGIVQTAYEPFNKTRHEELILQMEAVGDHCHNDGGSLSIEDDKGNILVLSPYILRQSVFMVEK